MKKEKLIYHIQVEDLKAVIDTVEGRRFVWRLLNSTGFRNPTFTTDSKHTAYNLGRKSVADELFELLLSAGRDAVLKVLYAAETDKQLMSEKGEI